jgi:hypothetical protein
MIYNIAFLNIDYYKRRIRNLLKNQIDDLTYKAKMNFI